MVPRSGRGADREGRLKEAEEARWQSLKAWESVATALAAGFPHGRALAHYRLGELLHGTGRTQEARHEFDQAQTIMEDLARRRPEESICHWQLICLLANCPDPALRDPVRAVALAQHVLPPSAGHYWRYLALAQYRSQQWQKAAESIQQAMDLRQGGDANGQTNRRQSIVRLFDFGALSPKPPPEDGGLGERVGRRGLRADPAADAPRAPPPQRSCSYYVFILQESTNMHDSPAGRVGPSGPERAVRLAEGFDLRECK